MARSSWLRSDAQNRAFRTLLQGVAVTVILPALDAALQVLTRALGSGSFSWSQVGGLAATAALTAGGMSVAAYVHRMVLDPSSIPSAPPPRPAGVSEAQAPATEAAVVSPRRAPDAARYRWPEDPRV
jgi:hypothetical protein